MMSGMDTSRDAGPEVAALTRRLAETPRRHLGDPMAVALPEVVSDLLGTPLHGAGAGRYLPGGWTRGGGPPYEAGEVRWRRSVLIACWLLADESLRAVDGFAAAVRRWFEKDLFTLSLFVDPLSFVSDADRREELVRVVLRVLGVTPAGEDTETAAARLFAVDSLERAKAVIAAKAEEEHARGMR